MFSHIGLVADNHRPIPCYFGSKERESLADDRPECLKHSTAPSNRSRNEQCTDDYQQTELSLAAKDSWAMDEKQENYIEQGA